MKPEPSDLSKLVAIHHTLHELRALNVSLAMQLTARLAESTKQGKVLPPSSQEVRLLAAIDQANAEIDALVQNTDGLSEHCKELVKEVRDKLCGSKRPMLNLTDPPDQLQ